MWPSARWWRLYFTFLSCYQHLEIFSEIWVMPVKLHFAVSQASLIFQKRFPDAGSIHIRPCMASTSCTRSHISATKQKIMIWKIRKNCPLKPSYVAPRENTGCYWLYRKVSKFWVARNLCCKHSKNQTKRFNHGLIPLDDKNGIANSEDPDQTAPLGAVWSGSALFAQTYLSENLG